MRVVDSASKVVENPIGLDARLDALSRPLVFTNGCFDILHRGHIAYLEEASAMGASLVVGINTDTSVRALKKAPGRPVNPLQDRALVLAALGCVDLVVPFADPTPLALIERVRPDILVKGGDWAVDAIVGNDVVRAAGGQVRAIPIRFRRSTSAVIDRIRSLDG